MSTTVVTQSARSRKRLIPPLVLIGIGLVWLGVLGFKSVVSGNRLWLIGGDVHLGTVRNDQPIRHRFWLLNPHLHEVSVKVSPSCGCSVANLPYDKLTPLNGFPVEVVIEPLGLPSGMEHEKSFIIHARLGEEEWTERVVVRFFLEAVPK